MGAGRIFSVGVVLSLMAGVVSAQSGRFARCSSMRLKEMGLRACAEPGGEGGAAGWAAADSVHGSEWKPEVAATAFGALVLVVAGV